MIKHVFSVVMLDPNSPNVQHVFFLFIPFFSFLKNVCVLLGKHTGTSHEVAHVLSKNG